MLLKNFTVPSTIFYSSEFYEKASEIIFHAASSFKFACAAFAVVPGSIFFVHVNDKPFLAASAKTNYFVQPHGLF